MLEILKEFRWVFLYLVGVFAGYVAFSPTQESEELYKLAKTVVVQCESTLPRNQHCKLAAILAEKEE